MKERLAITRKRILKRERLLCDTAGLSYSLLKVINLHSSKLNWIYDLVKKDQEGKELKERHILTPKSVIKKVSLKKGGGIE